MQSRLTNEPTFLFSSILDHLDHFTITGSMSSSRLEQFLESNSFDKEDLLKQADSMYLQGLSQSSVRFFFVVGYFKDGLF